MAIAIAGTIAIGFSAIAHAQQLPPFELLRYDEDYSHLRAEEANRSSPGGLKHIPLSANRGRHLSLGGEARGRYEYFGNPTFGQDPQDRRGVLLQRYVLHGDLRLGPRLRVFGQLVSALEAGRAGGPSPVDQNDLELQNVFVDVDLQPAGDATLTLRAGRQELSYGSARIVGVREGPNVRRTFDGLRAILDLRNWRIDALYARPRQDRPGVFDDSTDDRQALWGVYATGTPADWPAGSVDLYYLGFDADDVAYDQGLADETRHSLGARFWGAEGPWDWNWEVLYQFGSFGAGDIGAWTVATDTGYTWQEAPWQPRLALNANVASGDADPGDADLGTFNALFPRGSYFSEAAVLGPRNFFNVHAFIRIQPTIDWSVTTDLNFFWRLKDSDGVYAPNGRLIRTGSGSDERFVGSAISLTSAWQLNRYVDLTAIYSRFFAGAFIEDTGPAQDVDFFELTLRFRF